MRSHAFRPLLVIAALVATGLAVRPLLVPDDFGVGERGYMYSWHRIGSEAEARAVEPKFQPVESCAACHEEPSNSLPHSAHAGINCQSCHGPAKDHPVDPPKLSTDLSPSLCMRCHTELPYPNSRRGALPGIDPDEHYPGVSCSDCHNPHEPRLEAFFDETT
jgi:formate-dependent nitrite reductase cytochrome c552 subunit